MPLRSRGDMTSRERVTNEGHPGLSATFASGGLFLLRADLENAFRTKAILEKQDALAGLSDS